MVDKQEQKITMLAGNKVIHDLHLQVLRKRGISFKRLSKNAFRVSLFTAIDNQKSDPLHVEGVELRVPQSKIDAIQAVRKIQNKIIDTYHRMLCKLSHRWSCMTKESNGGFPEFEDFLSESHIAAVNAVYGYRKADVAFSTYLTYCVRNHFVRNYNETNPQSPLSNRDLDLIHKKKVAAREFNGPHNSQDLYDHMQLDIKDQQSLENMDRLFLYSHAICDLSTPVESLDYTINAIPIRNLRGIFQEKSDEDFDLKKSIIHDIQLTQIQEDIIKALAEGSVRGWQLQIAERHRCPRHKVIAEFTSLKKQVIQEYHKRKVA